jgi:glycosyltransferase involved in cell wall biosynthesis
VESFCPDIVYAHHTAPNGFLALKINRRFGIPYVITDHTYEDIDDALMFPGRRRLYEVVGSHAAFMIGVSKHMTQAHIRACVSADKAITLFNGSDTPDPASTTQPRPPELHDKCVITSVGMLYPRKGFPLLVRAFGRIAPKHPDAVLRIIGKGDERPAIEQAIRDQNLQSRVTLCGLQPRPRVSQELAWCDVFALVGWNEPWGVVYNEAMAAGKPILCANDGGINDVLVNGENALTVPPQDEAAAAAALDRLLSDPELRIRLGAAGKELFLSRLTWDANARQFAELFAQAVKERTAALS